MQNRKNSNGKPKRSHESAKKSKSPRRASGHNRRPSENHPGAGAGNTKLENA